MIEGVSGSLVSHHYAEHLLGTAFAGRLGEGSRDHARRRIRAWWRRDAPCLGPASSLRAVFDLGAAPLVGVLGFSARQPRDALMTRSPGLSLPRRAGHEAGPGEAGRATLLVADVVSASVTVPLLVGPWGAALDPLWGAVARESARLECRCAVVG